MITTAPRLRIRRPSPTAAEFTVTTLPPPTLPLRLLGALLLALRLALALATLLLLRARWTTCPIAAPRAETPPSRPASLLSAEGLWYALDAWDRAPAGGSLLVLRGLGVQTTESAGTWFSGAATRFIPTEKIQDILVNEAFRRFEVRYYLIVVVEGEEDVVVVFPGLLPKRSIVEAVWRGARECLYEGRAEDSSKGPSI
ncbi:hypothetical protein ACCO45_005472 [Purpureocillium lilacinum]|uniref:Uncharacterized protein n=1 Tax=Purpureocillium lilacinum TaxID=33203 RepID=A0ACC4DVI6_PURLI